MAVGVLRLSLELFKSGPTDHFFDLLRNISLPGLVLNFLEYVPCEALVSLINLGHLKGIRTLAFSRERFTKWFSEEELTVLLRACEEMGFLLQLSS